MYPISSRPNWEFRVKYWGFTAPITLATCNCAACMCCTIYAWIMYTLYICILHPRVRIAAMQKEAVFQFFLFLFSHSLCVFFFSTASKLSPASMAKRNVIKYPIVYNISNTTRQSVRFLSIYILIMYLPFAIKYSGDVTNNRA